MRLCAICTRCGEEIYLRVKVGDRFALAKKKGNQIELHCRYCNNRSKYHVNAIEAKANKRVNIIAISTSVVGTALLFFGAWNYLWELANIHAITGLIGVLTLPAGVYYAIVSTQQEKVRYFNSKKYG